MSLFSTRSDKEEIMDDLDCSGEVVHQTLRELEFINQWLGGNKVTVSGLDRLVSENSINQKLSIADLGCGSGEMLKLVNKHLKGRSLDSQLIGIDANINIIKYAEKNCNDVHNISFQVKNILDTSFHKEEYDVIIATLFLHHFSDKQLIKIFRHLKNQVRVGIVINDLHRHPLAFYSIRLLTWLFSRSSMVKYDAPLSVLRGFRKKELMDILHAAGIRKYTLSWRWAFRWQIIIHAQGRL